MITLQQFQKITNIKDINKLNSIFSGLTLTCEKYQINTKQRLSHFLAQIMVECEDFTHFSENLNYSAKALLATFPTHFNAAQAQEYARQPQKIANRAYANRMGNSDEASGDGWNFRGRGAIQITGKINYKDVGHALGLDLISHPELLEESPYNILSAGYFWASGNLNAVADKSGDDVTKITKIINGGTNDINQRKANYNSIKTILN